MQTPLDNIRILQTQLKNLSEKKKDIEKQLIAYDDKDINSTTIDEIEKLENELEFLKKYYRNLEDQLVVIMNEHNVHIPTS